MKQVVEGRIDPDNPYLVSVAVATRYEYTNCVTVMRREDGTFKVLNHPNVDTIGSVWEASDIVTVMEEHKICKPVLIVMSEQSARGVVSICYWYSQDGRWTQIRYQACDSKGITLEELLGQAEEASHDALLLVPLVHTAPDFDQDNVADRDCDSGYDDDDDEPPRDGDNDEEDRDCDSP
ncbi:hypothetical protein ACFLZH_05435 [Patescibacteria group bacterium]